MGILGSIQEIMSVITCVLALFAGSWARSALREGREVSRQDVVPALETAAGVRLTAPRTEALMAASSAMLSSRFGDGDGDEAVPAPSKDAAWAEVPVMLEGDLLARVDALAEQCGVSREEMLGRIAEEGALSAQRSGVARQMRDDFVWEKMQEAEADPESGIKGRRKVCGDEPDGEEDGEG